MERGIGQVHFLCDVAFHGDSNHLDPFLLVSLLTCLRGYFGCRSGKFFGRMADTAAKRQFSRLGEDIASPQEHLLLHPRTYVSSRCTVEQLKLMLLPTMRFHVSYHHSLEKPHRALLNQRCLLWLLRYGRTPLLYSMPCLCSSSAFWCFC